MEKKNIDKSNCLIAEFMGAKVIEKYSDHILLDFINKDLYPDDSRYHGSTLLKYHSSWDWLMPVVEKIEQDSRANICIWIKDCWIEYYGVHDDPSTWDIKGKSKIEAVYKAVVKFIKFYNTL